jgi:PilZ domain
LPANCEGAVAARQTRWTDAIRKEGSVEIVAAETDKDLAIQFQAETRHYAEMQSAPRFPLHLPVSVKSQTGDYAAETQNISANGVLFAMDRDVPVGSMVDFTILLPGDVVGSGGDVQIDCRGRVVRSFEDQGRRGVGVVIDEYHFERA